jgi:hypothetical protein
VADVPGQLQPGQITLIANELWPCFSFSSTFLSHKRYCKLHVCVSLARERFVNNQTHTHTQKKNWQWLLAGKFKTDNFFWLFLGESFSSFFKEKKVRLCGFVKSRVVFMLGGPLPPSLFSIGKGFILFFLYKKNQLVGHLRFVVVFIFIKIITEILLYYFETKNKNLNRSLDWLNQKKTKLKIVFLLFCSVALRSQFQARKLLKWKNVQRVYIYIYTHHTIHGLCFIFIIIISREKKKKSPPCKEEEEKGNK